MASCKKIILECSDGGIYVVSNNKIILASILIKNHLETFPDENSIKCPYTFEQINDFLTYLSSPPICGLLEDSSLLLIKKYHLHFIIEIFNFFMFNSMLYRYHEALYLKLRHIGNLSALVLLSKEEHFSWLASEEALSIQADFVNSSTNDYRSIINSLNNIIHSLSKLENMTRCNNNKKINNDGEETNNDDTFDVLDKMSIFDNQINPISSS